MAELIRAAIVGTGYAARARAEALQADDRAQLVAIAGHSPQHTATVAASFGVTPWDQWQALVADPSLDLVVVSHVNSGHEAVVRAALEAGKHVVVEYPLALSVAAAASLIALAQQRQRLLHVEHIELLGGLHQAMQAHLPTIGTPAYVRYSTVVPQRPAPPKWTFAPDLFGFPLIGALSRLHRLTNLFGPVATVACQLQYDGGSAQPPGTYFTTCRCTAQLKFQSGLVAEVLYGKGEEVWAAARHMVVQGRAGALVFEGDRGSLLQGGEPQPIEVGSRRGLFKRDTEMVLDALTTQAPLYVTPEESLYALRVGAAAQTAAATGQTVAVE
ncbi:MAG: Gfo/Idh/MocA family oxidoreductase [Leptolyngbya sp.]|nr:Gfo/Idh/MocA family oxidoreductase [Leptolyngbya sp.]